MSVGKFTPQVNVSSVEFDFSPEIGKSFSEEFYIAFFGCPVRVKVTDAEDLGFFTIGELIQDGRPGFTGQRFAVKAYALFSDGKSGDLFAVGKVKVNFSSVDKGFAVKRFTNDRIWYIIILRKDHFDKIV